MPFKLVLSLHRHNHVGASEWNDGDQPSGGSREKKLARKSRGGAHRSGNPVAALFARALRRDTSNHNSNCGAEGREDRPEAGGEQAQQQRAEGCGSSQTLHDGAGRRREEDAEGKQEEEHGGSKKKGGEFRKIFAKLQKLLGRKEKRMPPANKRFEPGPIYWRRSVETVTESLEDLPGDRRALGGSLESVRSAERLGVVSNNAIAVRDVDGHIIKVLRPFSDKELKVGRAAKVEMTETERDRNSVCGRVNVPGKISNSLEKITEQEPFEEEDPLEVAVTIEQGKHRAAHRRCSLESANLNTISE